MRDDGTRCSLSDVHGMIGRTSEAKAAAAPENAEGRDYRRVPVEDLRRFAQDETELTSIRHVAAEVGIGRTTLHKFVAGETMPHPRVRRLLAMWYLRRHGNADESEAIRPEESAGSQEARGRAADDVPDTGERAVVPATGGPSWFHAVHAFRGRSGRASPADAG